jgi:phosphatidylglycerophosphate synthase
LEETLMLIVHRFAAAIAMACMATFFSATVLVELFGSVEFISTVKRLIVWPGLLILVPSIAFTGASGFALAKGRNGVLVSRKRKRMPFIGMNGILILIPCAVLLNLWASAGVLDTRFYVVQAIELIAGAVNLTLMGLNMRDGFRMRGKFHTCF